MSYTTAYVYSDFNICSRCLFLILRKWLVDVNGLSAGLWRLPPKNSPVSCETSSFGESFGDGKKWTVDTIRSYHDSIQRLRDFGPSRTFWHNLMPMNETISIHGSRRHVTVPLSNRSGRPEGLSADILFCMWQGELALANVPKTGWINEEATVRMVSDLLGERALKQWTTDWLTNDVTGANMFVDGYFPIHSIAVEHQGIQHYEPIEFFGGEESFQHLRQRDEMKRQLLEQHRVSVLYIRYDEVDRGKIALKLAHLQASN